MSYKDTNAYKGAIEIVQAFSEAGYETYIVGGAVRDIALHREPHDYDIATAARPEEAEEVARRAGWDTTSVVGKVFGVVILKMPLGVYEVATFRSECYGADSHKPEKVVYAATFLEDVQRRDFTINGLALNKDGKIVDHVGGLRDIKKEQIQTIGNASARFGEDALRMFRACRFVGQLGFMATSEVVEGIRQNFHRVRGLSVERVRQELERILVSPYVAKGLDLLVRTELGNCVCQKTVKGEIHEVPIVPELFHLVGLAQEKQFHKFDGWYHTLAVVQDVKPDLLLRWAALLHDVGKGMPGIRGTHKGRVSDHGHDLKGAEMAEELLLRLGYNGQFVDLVKWLVENHMRFHYFRAHPEADIHKWIRKEIQSGRFRRSSELATAFTYLGEVGAADVVGSGKQPVQRHESVEFGECIAEIAAEIPIGTSDLVYDKEIMKEIGQEARHIMPVILKQVQSGQVKNEPTQIRQAIERRRKRMEQMKEGDN